MIKLQQDTKELIVGSIVWIVALLSIFLIINSCQTTAELHQRKLKNAKDRIDKILIKYPEIRSSYDTTYIKHDTVTMLREIVRTDSIFIPGSTIVDTVIKFTSLDTVFNIMNDNVDVRISGGSGGGQVRAQVNVKPHYVYKVDTFRYRDTVFINTVNTKTINTINTSTSWWWSLWWQVKGWLWFILVIIAILLVLRIIFKFVG